MRAQGTAQATGAADPVFQTLADSAPVMIWVADGDNRRTFFNRGWREFTGRSPDEEAGTGWSQGVHADDRGRCLSVSGTACDARAPFEMEYRLRRHDGAFRWIRDRGVPITRDGAFLGYVGSCVDVTAEREAAARIAGLTQELQRRVRELDTLLEVIPIGIGITQDAEGRQIHANRAFARQLRIDPGKNASKSGPEGDSLPFKVMKDGREVPASELPLQKAAATGEELRDLEFDIVFDDGSALKLLEYAAPLIDERGAVRGSVGAFVDITERTRTEHRMRHLARASELLAASPDYAGALREVAAALVPEMADWCAVDLVEDGAVVNVALAHPDPAALAQAREAARRYPPRLDRPVGVAGVMQSGVPLFFPHVTDDLLSSAAVDERHLNILRAAGLVSYICVPMAARGRTIGALTLVSTQAGRRFDASDLAFAQDLARRAAVAVDNARLFDAAQQTADELRRANAAKDEFLGLVSHELRTPITTIFGNAQVLRRRGAMISEEDREAAISDIETEATRLQRIIDNLFVLARVEAGQDVQTEPVLLRRIVAAVVEEHRRRFPGREVRVTSGDAPVPAQGEPTYLEQVLVNLLGNAEKYSPPGTPIDVEIAWTEDEARVRVLDRGRGIAPEDAERVFSPFFRGERAVGVAGAGMGLAVCKRLIEAQSGRIWALPRDGGGAEFGFTLPLAKEQER